MKIDDPKTLRFPCFDGNGMWLSMGNIADHGKVGLLFINAVTPIACEFMGSLSWFAIPLC